MINNHHILAILSGLMGLVVLLVNTSADMVGACRVVLSLAGLGFFAMTFICAHLAEKEGR